MSSLVLELQRDALNSSNNLTDLLRKALLVAKKLGIKDFQDWVISELNGYDDIKVIPKYRIVTGSIKALNPYQGWITCLIPDNGLDFKLTQREVGQSIGVIVSLLQNNKSGFLQTNYAPEVTQTLMSLFNTRFQIALHIDPSVISGILDAVQNTVLNWALKLEEEGILGEGMSFSKEEKEKALTSTSIHIENFQGILGNADNSTVTQNLTMTVQKGDFNSLSSFLSKKGISAEDIEELKKAIDVDPKPTSQSLGENVGVWLGKMVGKAVSGVWKIGVDVATNLLTSAIWAYYGIR
jgi:hypothetical protein